MNAALYARVSLAERDTGQRQNPAIQTAALEAWAAALGMPVTGRYVDTVSGTAPQRHRPALLALLDDASRHTFDVVLVVALDRMSRGGSYQLLRILNQLRDHGVELRSQREAWITTTGPMAEMLVAIIGWAAKMERDAIAERTKACARYLIANGRRVNRYTLWTPPDGVQFAADLRAGLGLYALATKHGATRRRVQRYLRRTPDMEALYLTGSSPTATRLGQGGRGHWV